MIDSSKIKKALLIAIVPLLTVSAIFPTFAQETRTPQNNDQNVTVTEEEVIEGDFFAAGETVTVSGTVNGDAYIAAGNVFIDGTINGDLLTAGGNVTIRGTIAQDARVIGGNIVVSADIADSLTTVGGNINVTDSTSINGSFVAAGGTIQNFAPVALGTTIAGGQATIGNTIGGNITAGVGTLQLVSGTQVEGDLTYWSEQEADIAQDATISGEITQRQPQVTDFDGKEAKDALSQAFLGYKLISLIASLIVGLILIKLAPLLTQKIADTVLKDFGKSLLVGFVTLILAPFIIIALLATLIGIPLALITIALLSITAYIGKLFVAVAVGQKVLAYANKPKVAKGWALIAGLIVLFILGIIPLIGWLIEIVVLFTGVGAILIIKKALYKDLTNKKII